MNDTSTLPDLPAHRSPQKARRARADATARWRRSVRHRPEPRLVDRVLMEAVCIVLDNRSIISVEASEAFARRMVELAQLGLVREGYDPAQIKVALGRRIVDHKTETVASTVRPALKDKQAGRPMARRPPRIPA